MAKIYLAGSMFCEADRMYNTYLAGCIRDKFPGINLYVPQENLSINDKTKCADSRAIFWGDYNRLKETDIFVARIDGDIPPSGTSAEIGMMSQRIQQWKEEYEKLTAAALLSGFNEQQKKELIDKFIERNGRCPMIIGLCTDSRNPKRTYLDAKNELMHNEDYESQYCYFNLFTVGCIKVNGKLATSVEELLNYMEEYIDAEQQ